MMRIQRQRLGFVLALTAENDDKFGCPKTISIIEKISWFCYVNILLQFRTNVSLFESVIRLVPAKLWNFLEARMLYDKCIEN